VETMPVLILASKRDIAAQHIASEITRARTFKSVSGEENSLLRAGELFLKHVETDSIYTENLGVSFSVECVIFASRHRSESGQPTLTTHWTGNCTKQADYGGKPKSLSLADPARIRAALLALDEAKVKHALSYSVSLEATHHGPTELGVPTLFMEIGSTERQWNDVKAARAVAEAILKTASTPLPGIPAIGFGGGHYCNKQSLAVRKGGYAFGHILSKYFFEEYDPDIVKVAFDRTLGDCRTAVVDWKGIRGSERSKLLDTLREIGVNIVRI